MQQLRDGSRSLYLFRVSNFEQMMSRFPFANIWENIGLRVFTAGQSPHSVAVLRMGVGVGGGHTNFKVANQICGKGDTLVKTMFWKFSSYDFYNFTCLKFHIVIVAWQRSASK